MRAPDVTGVIRWAGLGVLLVGLGTLAYALRSAVIPTPGSFWGVDFGDYWLAAARVLAGQVPYAPEMLDGPFAADGLDRYRYPPPFALIVAPLALLQKSTATWAWLVISGASLFGGCLLAARAGGVRLTIANIVWILAFLCLARPVHDLLLVGNVGGVEVLLIGVAIAASPVAGSAAVGALGLLKVVPVTTWPATVLRDWRAAAKGLALVAAGVLLTLPILWNAWLAYPVVLINQVRGGGADDPGNFSPIEVIRDLAPEVPQLALAMQLGVLALAFGLFIVSLRWATQKSGWVGALLAATVAGLLLPGTFWFHYLVLLIPFVAFAWIRLPTWCKVLIVVTAAALRFGPAPLRLLELGLVAVIVGMLLLVMRPGWVDATDVAIGSEAGHPGRP